MARRRASPAAAPWRPPPARAGAGTPAAASATALTATPTPLPTSTVAPLPSAPPTITPTQVEPSMANLPEEWVDRIEHIETMTEKDGKTTRVVAIEKLTEEDIASGKTEARLRVLQWDADAEEWINYQPQIGWAGWGDKSTDYLGIPTLWNEGIQIPHRSSFTEHLHYKNGSTVPIGYIGTMYYGGDRSESGVRAEYYQGYILEIVDVNTGVLGSEMKDLIVYTGFPLEEGDWIILVTELPDLDIGMDESAILDSLELPSGFGGFLPLIEKPQITFSELYAYFSKHGDELEGQPIIQGIGLDPYAPFGFLELMDVVKLIKNGELKDVDSGQMVFSAIFMPS